MRLYKNLIGQKNPNVFGLIRKYCNFKLFELLNSVSVIIVPHINSLSRFYFEIGKFLLSQTSRHRFKRGVELDKLIEKPVIIHNSGIQRWFFRNRIVFIFQDSVIYKNR